MSSRDPTSLLVYYEHPTWFGPLFQELDRRGVPYGTLNAAAALHDPAEAARHGLVFNRMSPSAWLRGAGSAIHYTSQFLAHVERAGARVINGWRAWQAEISKAYQLSLLERLGLPYPRARVVHSPPSVVEAAGGLRFPVLFKPNIGGSGAGIRRFDTSGELAAAAAGLDFGLDHVALVQEYVPAREGRIVRVEVLDGRYLYAIRIYTDGSDFNLCPADVCLDMDGRSLERAACAADAPANGLRVEGHQPPREIIARVEAITAAAGIEIGGVEYMIDDRDGRACFYDINALSNFVADAPSVIGFDPVATLADWLEREAGLVPAGTAGRSA